MRKKPISSVLLIVLIFTSLTVFSQSVPTEMIGTWSGKVTSESSGRTYTARLILQHANINQFAGNIVYSDLNCEADLTFRILKDGRAMFTEKVTANKLLCVDNGVILLVPVPDQPRKLHFLWEKKASNMVVKGTLDRQ